MKNVQKLFIGALVISLIASCSTKEVIEEVEEKPTTGDSTTVTDIDGNVYKTVTIGNQTWMAENLKVTKYSDGTPIPYIEDKEQWALLGENNTDKGFCYYNNNLNDEKDTFGALYTYAAVVNGVPSDGITVTQGVCPDGWHVPTSNEWVTLEEFVGGTNVAGKELKDVETFLWEGEVIGSLDNYGFSALPGGSRYLYDGEFNSGGYAGYWWTSQQNTTMDAYAHIIYNSTAKMSHLRSGKSFGFSVRCVKN